MKSVISNTSDSGCGERAGEAVSGEAVAGRERWGWTGRGGTGRDRRKEKTLTSLSAAILRCGPPHAQGPAGRRAGRGGCLTQRLIPAQRFVRGCGRTFSHLRGLFRREGVPTRRCKARIVLETLWVRQGPPGSKQNS